MEALITLLALPVVFLSAVAGSGCTFQSEVISIVQQDTSMTEREKEVFIQRVKTNYSECFVENS